MRTVATANLELPAIGLGTARMGGTECRDAVTAALELGYRHLDTAQMYGNEAAVGAGIERASIDRDEVFVTTKLDRGNRSAEAVNRTTEESAERLGVDTIDLLLMHSPNRTVPLAETLDAMNELQADGLVGHIGVSNFSTDQLEAAIGTSRTPIVTNQVEYHPYHHQDDLLGYCNEADVLLTAYSPLAKGRVADDGTLAEIGNRYDRTAAQVALRWLLEQPNVVAIPKASSPAHLEENLDVFDFALTEAEVERIFDLDGGLVDRLRRLLP